MYVERGKEEGRAEKVKKRMDGQTEKEHEKKKVGYR